MRDDETTPTGKRLRPSERQVFNVGDLGVNRVKSPVHQVDGTLLKAQNATFSRDRARHAIMKRPGLARWAGTTAQVPLGIFDIPFPDIAPPPPPTGMLYAYLEDPAFGTDHTSRTADGTTWAEGDWLSENYHEQTYGRSAIFGTAMYYPWEDPLGSSWGGEIAEWDGTTETTNKYTIPSITWSGGTYVPRQCYDLTYDGTYLYALVRFFKTGTGYLRAVMRVTWADGTVVQLGETFCDSTTWTNPGDLDAVVHQVAVWESAVWVSGLGDNAGWTAGKVYWIAPGGTNWTSDLTFGGTGVGDSYSTQTGVVGGGDELWVTFDGSTSVPSVVRTRTAAGVWATVLTSAADLPAFKRYMPVWASGARAYVWYLYAAGVSEILKYSVDSGGSWNDIATLAAGANIMSKAILFGGAVYGIIDSATPQVYEADGDNYTQVLAWGRGSHNILGTAGV